MCDEGAYLLMWQERTKCEVPTVVIPVLSILLWEVICVKLITKLVGTTSIHVVGVAISDRTAVPLSGWLRIQEGKGSDSPCSLFQ